MWDATEIVKGGRMCGAPILKKDRGNWALFLYSHDRKEGNYKRMNGAGKEKSCRGGKITSSADVCGKEV